MVLPPRPSSGPRAGAAQLIVPGSYMLTSYSAASGEKLWWVRGLSWQVKTTAVVTADTVYATGWAPGADAGEREDLPAFEDVIKEADKDGDNRLSPEEVPERLRHRGSWNAIDLQRDGFLDARDWSFYRARRSAHNVTMAVRPGKATGDLTDTHVLWRHERSVPQVPSPLLYQGGLLHHQRRRHSDGARPRNGRRAQAGKVAECNRRLLRLASGC